ncbi:TD and POZ domain-containing protein 4 [Argiope bruennichi]|uniref:TD and POZ domain-containing protein 4 n=1 Tax=Argiope bruennichi TaxID=94029 RepID=A0A8T0FFJ2_ARGBR|nr:TD and POZ domain-containing protein 4 [Argiope bruennichi]
MDYATTDSDLFSQVDDVKDIQIKCFSSISDCQIEHIHFVRKKHFYGQLYAVHVYPNGIPSEKQGYISVKVSKVLKDPYSIPGVGYDCITWTFSIVDSNGHGRYYQTVAKESVVNLPYLIEIPKFLTRSFVLRRASELLPGDILTVRCEVSFVFYSVQALHDDLVFDVNPFHEKERFNEDFEENSDREDIDFGIFAEDLGEDFESHDKEPVEDLQKALKLDDSSEIDNSILTEDLKQNKSLKSDLVKPSSLYDTSEDVIYYILILLGFLHEYNECKQGHRLGSKDLEFQIRLISKILLNADNGDEIVETYMWADPIFKVYIRLKARVKDILCKIPIIVRDEDDLENVKYNYHPLYTQGSFITFSDSFSVMTRISEVAKQLTNSSNECGNKNPLPVDEYKYLLKIVSEMSELNPMWEYLYTAMKYDESELLDGSDDEQDMTRYSDNRKETKWDLHIQTKDDVIFKIPFEEDKETFGAKLLASSSVFESMLRNPMVERLSKKVQLPDIDFRTFRNFLQFLQGSGVTADSFTELCDLYEMADKYNVEDLMFHCGLMFKPFLSEETVSVVEALASMHSDDFLLGAIQTFKNEHSDTVLFLMMTVISLLNVARILL